MPTSSGPARICLRRAGKGVRHPPPLGPRRYVGGASLGEATLCVSVATDAEGRRALDESPLEPTLISFLARLHARQDLRWPSKTKEVDYRGAGDHAIWLGAALNTV